MIYTKLTNEAMKIAYRAHHGRWTKAEFLTFFTPSTLPSK